MRAPDGMTIYLDRSGTVLQEFSPERGIIKIKDVFGTIMVWYRQTPPSTIPIHQSFSPNVNPYNWSGGAMNQSYAPTNLGFSPMPNLLNQNNPSAPPPPYEEINAGTLKN